LYKEKIPRTEIRGIIGYSYTEDAWKVPFR
jgi:hypothetical protein